MDKKPLAFVMAATQDLLFAAANVAIGINRHFTACAFDIIIYCDALTETDRTALGGIDNVSIRIFDLERYKEPILAKVSENSRFARNEKHLITLAHFEVFRLLDTYRKVTWLDIDILIQRNINQIIDFKGIVLTEDYPWTVRDNFLRPVEGFDMQVPSVCCGVLIVDDTIENYRALYDWCHENVIRYAAYLKGGDQPIFNLALQAFNLRPHLIPAEIWQCMPDRDNAIMARIVHFGGSNKIWCSPTLLALFSEWYRNLLDWKNLGGDCAFVTQAVRLPLRELQEREILLQAGDQSKERIHLQDIIDRLIHIEDKVNIFMSRN